MTADLRIALFQPDMPSNTGAIMRLCACMQAGLDIIEPCGFVLDDKKLRRAAMDYLKFLEMERHMSFDTFLAKRAGRRLILFTTKADLSFHDFAFQKGDVLLFGRESAGVPKDVHERVDRRLRIPMHPEARSLNLALSAAMAISEALRQTTSLRESGL